MPISFNVMVHLFMVYVYFADFLLLQAACKSNPNDEEALRAVDLLYDTAVVASGFTVSNCQNLVFRGPYALELKRLQNIVDEVVNGLLINKCQMVPSWCKST